MKILKIQSKAVFFTKNKYDMFLETQTKNGSHTDGFVVTGGTI